MTDKQIELLLNELNSDPVSPKFIMTQIAENLFFGKVWFNLPWENQTEYHGEKFYFINQPDHGFIGAVEQTSSDLHAFLLPEFRGKGIMCKALRETILPHLFWYNQSKTHRVTIDQGFHGAQFEKIEHSALLAGFKDKNMIVEGLYEYTAHQNDYPEFSLRGERNSLFSEKEFRFLHDRINTINAQLQYMKERYEIIFNDKDETITAIHQAIREFEGKYDEHLRKLI